ncbi:MAG TPA: hypothetical protein VGE15_11590 [Sphingobacteriaceae bacterium]
MRYILVAFLSGIFSSGALAADSTAVRKPSLTLAAVYGSNASYYGQTTADRLPYILTNASFRTAGGFYLSGSAYRLLNLGGSGISAMDASAGFDWEVTPELTAGIGYTRSFYPESSPLLQAGNKNTATASVGYDWQILDTELDGDYSFGAEHDFFVTLTNSKWISLGGIGSDKGYFTLEPSVEVVGGTRHYLEEYTIRKSRREKLQDWIKNPITPPGQDKTETVTTSKTSFDVLSYNLGLPIGYNRGNYLLEAGYQLSVLGKKVADDSRGPHSFFNLSFYYQF